MDMKLEVVVIPVSDVDRASEFYKTLGWRLDADVIGDNDFRLVQLTPPGSQCSVHFGTGSPRAAPGTAQSLHLIVSDVEAARDELAGRGVRREPRVPLRIGVRMPVRRGPHPGPCARPSAGACDLCVVRNVRRPRRQQLGAAGDHHPTSRTLSVVDVATLAELLHETAEHHGAFEARAPKHDWWDWYAPYLDARLHGSTSEDAALAADRYMREVRHVVPS